MATAMAGAPLAAMRGRHSIKASRGMNRRQGAAATHQRKALPQVNCSTSELVSCPSWSKPRVAMKASNPPSARARA